MRKLSLLAAAVLTLATMRPVGAETLKVAIPQKGLWDASFVDYANMQGFFKQEGLEVETLYTQGGAQTMQAVISGSVDIAMATGMLAIIGAYNKGAPVRVISAEMSGAPDIYWMAKGDSPIHSLKDLAGKNVGYSEAGSSSNLVLLALLQQAGVTTAHPVSVGGPPSSLTEVMSGQIPASWSAVPLNLAAVDKGTLRIIARGSESTLFRHETIRANLTTASVVANKRDALDRFNQVYVKAINWAYSNPKAIDYLAEGAHVSHKIAAETVHDFIHKENVQPYRIEGLEIALKQAADFGFTPKLLTPDEVAPLFADMIKPPKS